MRVNGEDRVAVAIDHAQERPPELEGRGEQSQNELALAHPVHRHVDVVAAARRVQAAGDVVAARADDHPFDIEEQIFTAGIVFRAAELVLGDRVERRAQRMRVGGRHDALLGQHDQMRVVNRHQRREELPFRVLEVLVEDAGHVLRGKRHGGVSIPSAGFPVPGAGFTVRGARVTVPGSSFLLARSILARIEIFGQIYARSYRTIRKHHQFVVQLLREVSLSKPGAQMILCFVQ